MQKKIDENYKITRNLIDMEMKLYTETERMEYYVAASKRFP